VEGYGRLVSAAPQAVTVCLVSPASLEQIRHDELATADFWLSTAASGPEVRSVLAAALTQAALRAENTALRAESTALPAESTALRAESTALRAEFSVRESGDSPSASAGARGAISPESALFRRLMPALSGGFDTDRLLHTYVEALAQFVHCSTHCLLWRQPGEDRFSVYAASGLPPELVREGRLLPTDALPRWYLHNARVLSREELPGWPDRRRAGALAGELDTFRGKLAVPLLIESRLAGLLLLGEKITGAPYNEGELETLFLLSSYVALQVQSFGLHTEISRSRGYMERILTGMSSGVITLGREERIAVCNPYAAAILGVRPEDLEGHDLRALPSPLGDYLYAAFLSTSDAVSGQEVAIRGGALTLRLSTSHLADERGEPLGSVLLLEDMTAQIALLTERHRRERLDVLTQVVGSLAHEVRTPLTAVKTYAELAGSRGGDEDLRAFWQETVTPQIDRLDALISQLVELVQQPEPDFALVRLDELVLSAIEGLPVEGGPEPVVDVELDHPLARVIADPAQTRQALVYLLHYLRGADGSPVQVRLTGEHGDRGDLVVLTLQRLRPSAKEVAPEALFDPLQALHEANGGLGPAISRLVIENQGGTLEASHDRGRLCFRILFPAPALSAMPPAPPRPRPAGVPGAQKGGLPQP
jgi:nitrogen-specific signal transduction histidine kinase